MTLSTKFDIRSKGARRIVGKDGLAVGSNCRCANGGTPCDRWRLGGQFVVRISNSKCALILMIFGLTSSVRSVCIHPTST